MTDLMADPTTDEPAEPRFTKARGQLRFVLGLVVAGLAVAIVWRLLAPLLAQLGDSDEQSIGADLTLALVGLVAGIVTAVYVVAEPGPTPAVRSGAAVLGSLLGGLLAWPVGNLIGGPPLLAYGVVLVWPLGTALGLFVAAMLPSTARRFG